MILSSYYLFIVTNSKQRSPFNKDHQIYQVKVISGYTYIDNLVKHMYDTNC